MNFVSPLKLPVAFETGISSIDQEHKGLIAYLNGYLASCEHSTISNFDELFTAFISELEHHFESEEMIMQEAGYPGLEKHARHHQHCLDELRRLLERCRSRGYAGTGDVITFFQKIIDDVSKADLRFVDYLMAEDKMTEFKAR
ncbi:MAG: hemerythrin family protein [Rhodospirillales bacterium]|nr:hemerythrin family protein [Rhodospirillales bacterium]